MHTIGEYILCNTQKIKVIFILIILELFGIIFKLFGGFLKIELGVKIIQFKC